MYCKLICILYALLCGQNFILVKSGCYTMPALLLGKSLMDVVSNCSSIFLCLCRSDTPL
jgi:hypothetical protein